MAVSDMLMINLITVYVMVIILTVGISSSSSDTTPTPAAAAGRCFTSIFSFGDSITDTGNHCHILSKAGRSANNCLLPYGETFFHRPTGRSSDGRLIIDFIQWRIQGWANPGPGPALLRFQS
ncbi:unnamed protein product [Linum trigynum]|uniref:GDSL esterase/lipase n=1 Tax=Linum trigynum TaxID=586398 RepID=A0AAV2EK09_9ROSI